MVIPMMGDQIVGHTEGFVLTIFAAYQGSAEAGTWILLSYVWSFVELIPSTFAEATSVRLIHHLGKARVEFAQELCFTSIKIGIWISIFSSVVLAASSHFFAWCLSLDETLEGMLLQIIPYIVICQPFVSIGTILSILNDALHIYKSSTAISATITVVFMIPFAALMTYYFHYNIEGLAAAMCVGYTAMGVSSSVIFVNADWDRAIRKAQIQ